MAQYTFRVHRFVLEESESMDLNKNNQYINEVVEAESVEAAMSQLVSKYGDETQARIFLRKVN